MHIGKSTLAISGYAKCTSDLPLRVMSAIAHKIPETATVGALAVKDTMLTECVR